MLVPGLTYDFETFVDCLSDKGINDNVKVRFLYLYHPSFFFFSFFYLFIYLVFFSFFLFLCDIHSVISSLEWLTGYSYLFTHSISSLNNFEITVMVTGYIDLLSHSLTLLSPFAGVCFKKRQFFTCHHWKC